MKKSLIEESYKFIHQRVPLYSVLILFILMLYGGISSNIDQKTIAYGFGAVEWVPIIIIAVGSEFFAMEYRNNTITNVIYKNSNRLKVYWSKFLIIFSFGCILTVFTLIFTFLLKTLLVGGKYSWTANVSNQETLINSLLLNLFGTIGYLPFIIGISFMLIMLVKNNAVVIGIGLAIGFLGASFSVALLKTFSSITELLKWNPLNMIFITQQLANPAYSKISGLSVIQVIAGTLIYAIIFLNCGYILFKHRRV